MTKTKSEIVRSGYNTIKNKLDVAPVYPKDVFLTRCNEIDMLSFLGKSGNRKLIKYDISLYKSLFLYTDFLKQYTNKIFFPLRLKIAANGLKVDDNMLCRCKSSLLFNKQTQDFTKKFCKKCMPSPGSKEWYTCLYGDEKGMEVYIQRRSAPERVSAMKRAGRKSFQVRRQRIFSGCLAKGKNETAILNKLEQIIGYTIKRDVCVAGYYPDGYCVETNTIYEVYEKYHIYKPQKRYDYERQQEIIRTLKCNFVIIHDTHNKSISDINIGELKVDQFLYV